jgi:hypothetical protein
MTQASLFDLITAPLAGKVLTCKQCGNEYVRDKGRNGTRYCGQRCAGIANRRKMRAWSEAHPIPPPSYRCGACGGEYTPALDTVHVRDVYLCAPCFARVRPVFPRLRNHRAPTDLIYAVARGELDHCPVCGIDIVTPIRGVQGRYRIRMVVDHDHRCCVGGVSKCGRCVRGVLCSRCNTVIGMLEEDPGLARAVASHVIKLRGEGDSR